MAAERLIVLIDDLGRASDPRERRLLGEAVRLQEGRLGFGKPPLPTTPEPDNAVTELERRREERRADRQREHDEEPMPADYAGTEHEWRAMSRRERFDFNAFKTYEEWERESADPERRTAQRGAQ